MSLQFGKTLIGKGHPVFVIAEIGINHEGSVETCAKMIEEAATAGASSIKLQTIDPERNYAKDTYSYELFSKAVLSQEETARMFEYTKELGMEPFTTAGDFKTLEWINKLDPSGFKVSSGLLSCLPIIKKAASFSKPILMSTGMADEANIQAALDTVKSIGNDQVALFQCTSLYPAENEDLNLASIPWMEKRFNLPVGFSDHSIGTAAASLSVAAGAVMIEKHFTLDKKLPEYDHRLSLEPKEFALMVESIRQTEKIMGTHDKVLSKETSDMRDQMSRYMVVATDLKKGHILQEEDILFFRLNKQSDAPLNASMFRDLIGHPLRKDMKALDAILQDTI
ncbi:N-acetylneuraminate synthase family protein [Kiloniella sp. EL199]|uniref:N-acetylneuraminate synthase family protein n=1 Tax=Kiloniella sp. EL199 TaxID=2107581 RepID=UPI0013C50B9F|nr:N-acetylneuraminate synthase family protein [Kiloniella sp. EL199]